MSKPYKKNRKFRVHLKRVLGRHDWCCKDTQYRQALRALLNKGRYQPITLRHIFEVLVTKKMHERVVAVLSTPFVHGPN